VTTEIQTIRGVLFDATGTLFDLSETVGAVYARYARKYDVDLPAWRIDDAFARIMARAPARVFPDSSNDEIGAKEEAWWRAIVRSTFLAADSTIKFRDAEAFYAELFAFYRTKEAWTLRPGTRELLGELKQRGVHLGVVSNFDQRLPVILQALELAGFLDTIMTPALCGCEKPDRGIFDAALRELALPADAVLFVGDHPEKDRAAAEQAGMRSFDPDSLTSFPDLTREIERFNAGEIAPR